MNEELLQAIIQLFAIVAKERITDDERTNIREFLSIHIPQDSIEHYMNLFDSFCTQKAQENVDLVGADEDTVEFVDDWAKIMSICKLINEAFTQQQKLVLLLKMIELMLADNKISERQSNMIFYIGEATKINQTDIDSIIHFVQAQDLDDLNAKNTMIVDDGSGEIPAEFNRVSSENLTGMIFILQITAGQTYFLKYLGISPLTLNGVPLKSRHITVFPTGSAIRGNKTHPIYYSDVISRFQSREKKDQISFIAEDVSFKFKSGDLGLRNINIAEKGGKLIGLMGASGSGKSTLLNVLNGSEAPSSGRVLINEVNLHKQIENIEGVIGYVPQDDFLIEDLSVYDNMYYAAKLCFSQFSDAEIHELVNKTLRNLGLFETRDLKVGAPLEKTISGGQRKRLNIGLELLREPTVLFVDEPTSGLSSRDSENIMDLLKELSLRGKMVFVVIHQPSSDIFKMFDTLLILDVGGYQVYYGNPVDSVVYFKTLVNMVNKDQGECPECGNINAEQVFSIIETRIVNEYGRFTDQRRTSPEIWHDYYKKLVRFPQIEAVKGSLKSTLKIPGRLKQLAIFTVRDVLAKISDKQYLIINILEAPVLAFFLAFLVKYYATVGVVETQYFFGTNDNIPVFFFMSIIVALFMGLTVSAEEIIKDRKILKRERFLHLSRASYLFSKVSILFGISAIQTMAFVLIGNLILEIRGMNISYWLILFAVSCFANVLGLNISSAFKSAITVYILIPLLLIPQLVLSGVVVSFDKFNPKVTTMNKVPMIGEIMTSRWAFEAAMVTQFKDNRFESLFYELNKRMADAEYMKTYYIPALESHLTRAMILKNQGNPKPEELEAHLALLQNELPDLLNSVRKPNAINVRRFNALRFDSIAFNQTTDFISTLRRMHINRFNNANDEKDRIALKLTGDSTQKLQFNMLRATFKNQNVTELVENLTSVNRIIQIGDELVRKIYPIYMDPNPNHYFDFRTQFFAPKKYFLGTYFTTLAFNLGVIWLMIVFLFIALYFDWLRKLVSLFGGSREP